MPSEYFRPGDLVARQSAASRAARGRTFEVGGASAREKTYAVEVRVADLSGVLLAVDVGRAADVDRRRRADERAAAGLRRDDLAVQQQADLGAIVDPGELVPAADPVRGHRCGADTRAAVST
jgi:hypothetical protein